MKEKENFEKTDHYAKETQFYIKLLPFIDESTDDYFFIWDVKKRRVYFTARITKQYPLEEEENGYTLKQWLSIVHPCDKRMLLEELNKIKQGQKDTQDLNYRLIDRMGKNVWISCRGNIIADTKHKNPIMIGRICENVFSLWEDELTGLMNASKMAMDFEKKPLEQTGYLMVLGIDNLKDLNDKSGRIFGNQVLQSIAIILEKQIKDIQKIYRLDGDKFGIVLPKKQREYVKKLYLNIKQELERQKIGCTISAGAAEYFEGKTDGNILYQFAENALMKAKKDGRNHLVFFSKKDYKEHLSFLKLQDEIVRQVKEGFSRFYAVYQVQIRTEDYAVVGAEALMRFCSETSGEISPTVFIPILEQTGMICQAGLWMLRQAVKQCKIWREEIADFQMSVNLSYVQMKDENVVNEILEILDQENLPGEALCLELTEGIQLQEYQKFNHSFYRLGKRGIQISIDDFGTGYSTMNYLKRLNIDEIKIDRCFVRSIQHSDYNYKLVKNMIELADSAQIKVCVEGVEFPQELFALKELKPEKIQGFLFGRPLKEDVFYKEYIQNRTATMKRIVSTILEQKMPLKKENQAIDLQTNLIHLVDSLDEIIYVSDIETYELYYLNKGGKKLVGKNDYQGQKCYRILQGLEEPCPFCTNHLLNKSDFYIWEIYNEYLKSNFIVKDKLIQWNGKPARMEIAIDITERENISKKTKQKLRIQETIVNCIRILREEENLQKALSLVLGIIGVFHKADRAYIFEFDETGTICYNVYQWCERNVAPLNRSEEVIPAFYVRRWIKEFKKTNMIIIEDIKKWRKSYYKGWQYLTKKGIEKIIIAPCFDGEKLIGFIGIDNPGYLLEDGEILNAISFFVTDALKKYKLEKQLYFMSYHDALTGVLNRNGYMKDMQQLSKEESQNIGIVYADINGLKRLNDERGHNFGDIIIKQTAFVLKTVFLGYDVYRIGGDEFVVICKHIEKEAFFEKIKEFSQKIKEYKDCNVSVGEVWMEESADISVMVSQADRLMYENKQNYYRSNYIPHQS